MQSPKNPLLLHFFCGPSQLTWKYSRKKRPIMVFFSAHITLCPELDLKHQEKKQKGGEKTMWVTFGKQCVCVCVCLVWWRQCWWEASSQDAGCSR